jgi:fatty acid desaturase
MNINRHTAHHTYPQVGYDQLPRVSTGLQIRQNLDERSFKLANLFAVTSQCIFVSESAKNDDTLTWQSIKGEKI